MNARTGVAIVAATTLVLSAIPALTLEPLAFSEVPLVGFLWILLVALLTYPMGNLLNYTSVSRIGSARAVPLWSSAPVFATVLAVVFLDERPNAAIIMGIVAIVAGIIFIVSERSGGKSTVQTRTTRAVIMGYACGIGAGASYGASNFLAKIIVIDYGTPLVMATISMGLGLMIMMPFVASDIPRVLQNHRRFVSMFVLAGLAGGTGVIALFFALERGDVVVVSPIISTSPLITLILAHLFLQRLERLTIPVILGALLVVGGTALVVAGDRL